MSTSFREQAEARIEALEAEERDRAIAREERAAKARAGQHADAQRRRAERRAEAERAAAAARDRLRDRFGPAAAERVDLGAEYHCFVLPVLSLAIAYRRDVDRRRAPGLVAAGPANPSWEHQRRLQAVLDVGVGLPEIVAGDRLADRVDRSLALLVDPDLGELRSHAPQPEPRTPR